jgi:tRNA 2-selenouridine synthase
MNNTTATTSSTSTSLILFVVSSTVFVGWQWYHYRQPQQQHTSTVQKYRGLEAVTCPTIDIEQALQLLYAKEKTNQKVIVIDTRTPKEYQEAHVWGAINIPLMSNDQRHLIGLTYHTQSRAAAIFLGWKLFTPHIHSFVQQFEPYRNYDHILIYCWRGGMRSRIVVNLLRTFGYGSGNDNRVQQITGGYKHYLNRIVWKGLDQFAQQYPPKFIVLFGHTGTRKTEILRTLRDVHGLPVVDLEGLAGHRSSVYGAVGLQPASQKMFSIALYHTLWQFQNEPFIFIEVEANKVGDVHVPPFVCDRIAGDVKILVQATISTRVDALCREYCQTSDFVQQIHDATETVRKYVGHKNADYLHSLLDQGDFQTFTEWLLVNHYDPTYRFDKKGHVYNLTVDSDNLEVCCAQLEHFYQQQCSVQQPQQQQQQQQQ